MTHMYTNGKKIGHFSYMHNHMMINFILIFSLSWLQGLTLLPTGGVTANQNITLGGVAANQNTTLQDVQRTAPPPRPKSR